ncbi:MAG TPA: nuclear transport factor 2 family protein [Longimicrobium sp.]
MIRPLFLWLFAVPLYPPPFSHGGSLGDRVPRVQLLDHVRVVGVRVTMSGWIDYMHMARVDGRWQIVNVLWELKPRG